MAFHVFTAKKPDFERFYNMQEIVRKDFDKIYESSDQKAVELMLEKY